MEFTKLELINLISSCYAVQEEVDLEILLELKLLIIKLTDELKTRYNNEKEKNINEKDKNIRKTNNFKRETIN